MVVGRLCGASPRRPPLSLSGRPPITITTPSATRRYSSRRESRYFIVTKPPSLRELISRVASCLDVTNHLRQRLALQWRVSVLNCQSSRRGCGPSSRDLVVAVSFSGWKLPKGLFLGVYTKPRVVIWQSWGRLSSFYLFSLDFSSHTRAVHFFPNGGSSR